MGKLFNQGPKLTDNFISTALTSLIYLNLSCFLLGNLLYTLSYKNLLIFLCNLFTTL